MARKRDEVVAEVLADFDFDKVHKAMVAVEWKWGLEPGRIPTRDELVACARGLLERIWDRGGEARLGGFVAGRWKEDAAEAVRFDEKGRLRTVEGLYLRFVVEHASADRLSYEDPWEQPE